MDLQRFSEINRQRCEAADGFKHKLMDWSLSDWMTATMGELGEAANVVKKLNRVRDGVRGNRETETELRAKLARELADVVVYLDLTFQRLGLDMGETVQKVFNDKSDQIGCKIKV
jgi:NTP pyrophosphatase (non-canonical NTP hydrolase)